MQIRDETTADHAAIFAVLTAAFETDAEARLVDRLREHARPFLSLVAIDDEAIVGHVLFTPATVREHETALLMGLAPLAVAPPYQRRGVGSALVRAGLERCRALGAAGVVVLGHSTYYPRFGFSRADERGLRCVYDSPPESFMAVELAPRGLSGVSGIIDYHDEFKRL